MKLAQQKSPTKLSAGYVQSDQNKSQKLLHLERRECIIVLSDLGKVHIPKLISYAQVKIGSFAETAEHGEMIFNSRSLGRDRRENGTQNLIGS